MKSTIKNLNGFVVTGQSLSGKVFLQRRGRRWVQDVAPAVYYERWRALRQAEKVQKRDALVVKDIKVEFITDEGNGEIPRYASG